MEFTVQQIKSINEFRKANPQYKLYSDEAVLSVIKETKWQCPAKSDTDSLFGFGSGFISDMGLEVERTPSVPKKPPKTYSRSEDKELRNFAANYLEETARNALNYHKQYYDSIGYISSDAIVQGMKIIGNLLWDKTTGRGDIDTIQEVGAKLIDEHQSALKIKEKLNSRYGFEETFERERGVNYDPEKIEAFRKKSEEYVYATAWNEKYTNLKAGIEDARNAFYREQSAAAANQRGIPAKAPQESFDEKFIKIIDEFCSGDEKLKNALIQKVSKGIRNKEELRGNYLKCLDELENNCKSLMDKELNGKSFDEVTQEYNGAFKKTFGGENAEMFTEAYVMNQKMLAGYAKMGIVIASTVLLGGSNLMAQTGSRLAAGVGEQAAGHIIKAGMTAVPIAENMVIDVTGALTSKTGLTRERWNEIKAEQRASLPYMIFGAYASGPLGETAKAFLKTSPSVLPGIINKAFSTVPKAASAAGLSAEITADALFMCACDNASFADAFKEQGTMDLFMKMIAGGRSNAAARNIADRAHLKDYKIKEVTTENSAKKTYEITGPQGKFVTENPEEIIVGLLDKVGEEVSKIRQKAGDNEEAVLKFLEETNLGRDGENMNYRIKSEQSISDKITRLISEGKTPQEAVSEVFDSIGARTVADKFNYKDYPELAKLYKTNPDEAVKRAAEMQSQTVVDAIKNILLHSKESGMKIKTVSNYMGEDGIPYFSEKQMNELIEFASVNKIKDFTVADLTKKRRSGYTALQMNFETKDGYVFEWQYRGKEVNDFAEAEHVTYDLRQGKDISGGNESLKKLYEPVQEAVKKLSDAEADEYNKYLTDMYNYYRKRELGFECEKPILDKKFSTLLNAENLVSLQKISHRLKSNEITEEAALAEYKSAAQSRSNPSDENLTIKPAKASEKKPRIPFKIRKAELKAKLGEDLDLTGYQKSRILDYTASDNISLAEKLCSDPEFPKQHIANILMHTNSDNIKFAEKLYSDLNFPREDIVNILSNTTPENLRFAEKLCFSENFTEKDKIAMILFGVNEQNISLAEKLCFDMDFPKNIIRNILDKTTTENIEIKIRIYEKLKSDPEIPKSDIGSIIRSISLGNISLAQKLFTDPEFPKEHIAGILMYTSSKDIEAVTKIYEKLKADPEFLNDNIVYIMLHTRSDNLKLAEKLCADKSFPYNRITVLLRGQSFDYTPKVKEEMEQVLSSMKEKRNLLKSAVEDLSDKQIEDFLYNNYREIYKTLHVVNKQTFEAAFALKLDNFKEFCRKAADLENKLSPKAYNELIKRINPQNCIEYKEAEAALVSEIAALKKQFPQAKEQGAEALEALKKEINKKTQELRQVQQAMSAALEPHDAVMKIRTLAAAATGDETKNIELISLIKSDTPTASQINAAKNNPKIMEAFENRANKKQDFAAWLSLNVIKPQNDRAWSIEINKRIFEKLNIPFDEKLSNRLRFDESKYLSEILSTDQEFRTNFRDMIKMIEQNPDLSIKEIFDKLPQNIETSEMYKKFGIDYDKWVSADKNSFEKIDISLDADKSRQSAILNIEADFNDPAFKLVPKAETDKIFSKLAEIGVTLKECSETVYDADGITNGTRQVLRLYKGDKPIDFKDLHEVISVIKKEINSNDFWTKKSDDPLIENAVSTVYNHLMKLRDAEIKNALALKEEEAVSLEVHKTDMNNISHALFLGNHGGCCTAVGTGINQFSAPAYIMNKCISAIEIMDGKDFAGNSMCYIAKVDGVPSLVLDNIELSAKYQNNDQIRDAIVRYAERMTAEIGKPDMPIYAGPYRHKLNMDIYKQDSHEMQIIGSTGGQEVYLDFITTGREIDGNKTDDVNLYKIK